MLSAKNQLPPISSFIVTYHSRVSDKSLEEGMAMFLLRAEKAIVGK